jgi:hypothetical protein
MVVMIAEGKSFDVIMSAREISIQIILEKVLS